MNKELNYKEKITFTPNCNGSYILIEPILINDLTFKGIVVMSNMRQNFNKGDIVYYHSDDKKDINYDGKKLHAILHYQILSIEHIKVEREQVYDGNTFKFTGLSM